MIMSLPKHRKVAGFTLVELLVGLFLSLFIVGVALTYFVSSSRTFRTHTNESVIQENARFALEILARNIRHAGVNPSNTFDNEMDVIFSDAICSNSEDGLADGAAGGSACTRDGPDNATWNNSDRFAVDYMIDRTKETTNQVVTLCNGAEETVNAGTEMRFGSVFWTADIDNNGVRSLYCQGLNLETNLAEGLAVPLIEGVERIQVQYGVDVDNDGIVERYQSFTNLGAANSNRVRTMRVAMLMSSGLNTNTAEARDFSTEESQARTFTLLDGAPENFAADTVLRQIYTTSVMIHNNQGSENL